MYCRHYNHLKSYLMSWNRSITKTARIVPRPNLSASAYKPEFVEKHVYDEWEKKGLFKAENFSDKPTFSMVLPPPNVTGKLHLGHALASTIQDVIVRRKRSRGYNVLWLPGTDHAGIATQGVVEKYLKTTQDVTRHDLGRKEFNKTVWNWKEKHGNIITEQLRTLGCSLDWSREMFTMDQKHINAVNTAFVKLFEKGLIYRKKALVNWCTSLNSTVSDIEVDNIEIKGPMDIMLPGYSEPVRFGLLYSFAYKLFNSTEEVVVSTTMPETMMGDVAVAVHPDDPRYKYLRGQKVIHPFTKKTLPIIFDNFVDMDLGSGAVKITPAHSKIDYDVAKNHKLHMLQVIDEEGKMINSGQFDNQKRYDCRKQLVECLEDMGLLKKVVAHNMTLPLCSRSNDIIDYLPKEQWFLNCSKLNEEAAKLVENGKLKIQPEKFVKNWLNWCKDDRDWCVSRQLWWGHRVPGYKCSVDTNVVWVAAPNITTAKKEAAKILKASPDKIEADRDTDVLDTWFSSAIYPFSSLGWPGNYDNDYRKFYPLDLLATGHDILGLWVHRMVILGLELTNALPFNNVLLHGIICDSKGAKMSKTKGNVIDPIDVINGISMEQLREKTERMHLDGILNEKEFLQTLDYQKRNFSNTKGIPECGVDALRFTLLSQDIKSHFVNFDVGMCHANKLFCNKIWQSVKYSHLSFYKLHPSENTREVCEDDLTFFDKWILSRLVNMIAVVNKSMDEYDFHLATKALRTFMYNEFCDVYIETTKQGFDDPQSKTAFAHAHTLSAVLSASLRCLNPFMVYLTHYLIPKVPQFEHNIIYNFNDMDSKYYDFPKYDGYKKWQDTNLEKQVDKLLSTIYLIRQLKGLYGMSDKLRPTVSMHTANKVLRGDIERFKSIVRNLARCKEIVFDEVNNKNFVSGFLDKDTQVHVELLGQDIEVAVTVARDKLMKKVRKLEEHLARMEEKICNPNYSTTMPEWTQLIDRENLLTKREELKHLQRLIVDDNTSAQSNK